MEAPEWYEAWCEEAFEAFTAKQTRMEETYRLGSWQRYDYDTNAGVLTFSDEKGPRVMADIQVVGATDDERWLWGWADPSWPAVSLAGMRPVPDFGAENGIEELTTAELHSDDLEGVGWMLTAIAARILDAEGAYSAPSGDGAVYLLIRSLKFVS